MAPSPPQTPPISNGAQVPVQGYPAQGYPAPQYAPYQTQYPPPAQSYGYGPYRPFYLERRRLLIRRLCYALISALILLGVAILITYLVLRPRIPRYIVEDLRFNNVNFTQVNNSGSSDYMTLRMIIRAYNPNKRMGVYNDYMGTAVYYKQTALGKNYSSPFYLGHRSDERISLNIPVSLNNSDWQSAVNSNSVPLKTFLAVKARFKIGSWKTSWVIWIYVNCDITASSGGLVHRRCVETRD